MALRRSGTAYFNVGDVSAIDITGTALTVVCWFWRAGAESGQALVSKWNTDSTAAQQYRVRLGPEQKVRASVRSATTETVVDGATTVAQDAWSHYGLRNKGTGASDLEAFLNGVSDGAGTGRSIQGTAAGLHLFSDANAPNNQPNGDLCEVGIWNVALSDGEMLALGRGLIPPLVRPGALRGYWPLHGNVLSPAVDLSGNRNSPAKTGAGAFVDSGYHAPVGRYAMLN